MSPVPVCALDGCDNTVGELSYGGPRRYCCAAHRKIARKGVWTPPSRSAVADAPVVEVTRPADAGAGAAVEGDQVSAAGAVPLPGAGAASDVVVPAGAGEVSAAGAVAVPAKVAEPSESAGDKVEPAGDADVSDDAVDDRSPGGGHAQPDGSGPGLERDPGGQAGDQREDPGSAASSELVPDHEAFAEPGEPPTEPIPISRAGGTGSTPRTVVPEPRSRWFRRNRPYAARGIRSRARYPADLVPSQPEWLRSGIGSPKRSEQPSPRQQQAAQPVRQLRSQPPTRDGSRQPVPPSMPSSGPAPSAPRAPLSDRPARSERPLEQADPGNGSPARGHYHSPVRLAVLDAATEVDASAGVAGQAPVGTAPATDARNAVATPTVDTVDPAAAPVEADAAVELAAPGESAAPVESASPAQVAASAEMVATVGSDVAAVPEVEQVPADPDASVDVAVPAGSEVPAHDGTPGLDTAPIPMRAQPPTAWQPDPPTAPVPVPPARAAEADEADEAVEPGAVRRSRPWSRRREGNRDKKDTPLNPHPAIQAAWLGELREALSAALHSLSANRLRSLLTTVGIIAGVASVIVLVAMGNGMEQGFNDQFSRFATQLTVQPITGPVATGKVPQHLTDADFRALHNTQEAPDVGMLSAAVASNSVTLAVGQKKAGSQLFGIQENYLELANRHPVAGTWFTSKQIADGDRHAVIGPQVVNALWGAGTDPHTVIGQPLRVGHSTFQIQGVVNSDGQSDNVVMVPLNAARAFVVGNNAGKLDVIIAKSTSTATLQLAKAQIFQILYTQHHVRVDTDRDFNVTDYTSILEQQLQTIKFLRMFIVAIAGISLFVGGVGVANIMLVAVTERTREIGIRKAIGAPRRAIMRQFLSEAVMLTALGGLVGVVLGVGLCELGKFVIPKLWPPDPSSLTPTPLPILSLSPVLLAFGVSLVIGLAAGGYPAHRASRLRPIQALRFE